MCTWDQLNAQSSCIGIHSWGSRLIHIHDCLIHWSIGFLALRKASGPVQAHHDQLVWLFQVAAHQESAGWSKCFGLGLWRKFSALRYWSSGKWFCLPHHSPSKVADCLGHHMMYSRLILMHFFLSSCPLPVRKAKVGTIYANGHWWAIIRNRTLELAYYEFELW